MEQSVKRLKECFRSVVMSLQHEGEERGDAKALGLHKLLTEYRFVCTLLLMCDVLPHISHLSKCFSLTYNTNVLTESLLLSSGEQTSKDIAGDYGGWCDSKSRF